MRRGASVVVGLVLAAGLLAPGAAARPAEAEAEAAPRGCDPLDPAACVLPFPSDWHTVPDASTDTGRRVAFVADALPANVRGTHVDPAEWNRNDGFSPGSMVLAQVPGLDLGRTGAAPVTDIGASLDRDAPIVLLDLDTGQRHPYWAELDANADDPARRALIVRPARNLAEGHHYAVVLRDLRDADGTPLPAPDAYRKVAGKPLHPGDPLYERQRQLRPALRGLARAGIDPRGAYLVWDFTVASERGLSERMLHLRDESFRELGDEAPEFLVTEVREHGGDDAVARSVRGVFNVPSYLDRPGGPPGSGMRYGPDGLPQRAEGNVQVAAFRCEIPRSALTRPAWPGLYGHGLFGREAEVGSGAVTAFAAEHHFVLCATKWQGMADEDVAHVARTLTDLSDFHTVPDRLQQGVLNTLWLGRLMTHPDGLAADPAFAGTRGRSVLSRHAPLGFYGNSQGAIMGGMVTALSTEVRRSALGVPGMNYSTLLNRSTGFAPFQRLLDTTYPDTLDQQIGFALLQMLWDRGEANGYAHHMTDDPLPGTPRHQVLLHVAFGDHLVTPHAAEVQARTVGARVHTPAVAEGRSPDADPYWGIRPLRRLDRGSGLVVWDSGSPHQPLTNTPPDTGHDPHGDPRHDAAARLQMAWFLKTGLLVDVCGNRPCRARPRD
ncbi:hypothetical protein GCM10023347_40670 [Streptomyces chumphonensis]|uniref:ATP-dependent DNA helicase RecG n=2 Tax=Streptomyces chumphonensis TaxID=1214925 RepID=A0A927EWS4_9ACTN|nr:hypothetical protein [Streptomyces chumphonensis]